MSGINAWRRVLRHKSIHTLRMHHTSINSYRHPRNVLLIHVPPSIRNFSNGQSKDGDSTEMHKSYFDQMKELEEERIELFGSNESTTSASSTPTPTSPAQNDMEINLEQMNQEREALYAFTSEEKLAWGNSSGGTPPTLSPDFLETVQKAREAKAAYEEQMQREIDDKAMEIAQKMEGKVSQEHKIAQLEEDMKEAEQYSRNEREMQLQSQQQQPFTHLNQRGDQVAMVDVGHKEVTRRVAIARSSVVFPPEVMDVFEIHSNSSRSEMIGTKGPIFSTARLAGIMGAKQTSNLIPLCHPLPLDKVHIDIHLEGNTAIIECECCVSHKTGVEMEALAGASIAALTIYDMVKAVSHNVTIERTELVTKKGGKRTIEDGVHV